MDKITCCKCYTLVEFNDDDCTEVAQEETFTVVECPKCGTKNAISWSTCIEFSSREADSEEVDEYLEA